MNLYGRRCPPELFSHEVAVTRFALLFPHASFQRGATINRADPDLLMTWEGRRCAVEIDMEHMDRKKMSTKWARYSQLSDDEFILVVCLTEKRMKRLIQGAERVSEFALFTTFDRLTSGMTEPWVTSNGETLAI